MATDTLALIRERLQMLPPEKLATVLDFVTFLAERSKIWDEAELEAGYRAMAADEEREREAMEWIEAAPDEAMDTMCLSEHVLRRDWDTPEEDEAWSHL